MLLVCKNKKHCFLTTFLFLKAFLYYFMNFLKLIYVHWNIILWDLEY